MIHPSVPKTVLERLDLLLLTQQFTSLSRARYLIFLHSLMIQIRLKNISTIKDTPNQINDITYLKFLIICQNLWQKGVEKIRKKLKT